MGLLRTSCDYCGDTGVDDSCDCGLSFHYDCARNRGHLQAKKDGNLIRSDDVYYKWNCPSCPARTKGKM